MKPTLSILLTFFLLISLLIVTTAFSKDPNNVFQKEELRERFSRPILNLPITQATVEASFSYLERNGMVGQPIIKALSALVWESNNTFLFDKSSNVRRPIASITKLMTAAVVLDNASTTEGVTVSSFAISGEGNAGGLYPGEKLAISDLLHAMLLESSNDAAIALAEHIEQKTAENFVSLMNKKAVELELENTNFADPTGLNDTNSFSTT